MLKLLTLGKWPRGTFGDTLELADGTSMMEQEYPLLRYIRNEALFPTILYLVQLTLRLKYNLMIIMGLARHGLMRR